MAACDLLCDGVRANAAQSLGVVLVAIAGGDVPPCRELDTSGDGAITLEEVVAAIRSLHQACPVTSTPPPTPSPTPAWRFTDITLSAGLDATHGYRFGHEEAETMVAGGVAAGDYDGDGWIDLYVVGGDVGANRLFRNQRDGTFVDHAVAAGVALAGTRGSGPLFADFDGDGHLDLFVGGIQGTALRLFHNQGDGSFTDVTTRSGLSSVTATIGASAADFDRDGDLDLFLTHWSFASIAGIPVVHLWRNDGSGRFEAADEAVGLTGLRWDYLGFGELELDVTFTANFADINDDGWPDLLLAADYGNSRVFVNTGGHFIDATTAVISDENGMGAAVGDYDNDGDLDWFVSSIWDPNGYSEGIWGVSGNRLYRNEAGSFQDATDEAGVRQGYWGWGSCFADLDNDGWLDLFHVNGYGRGGEGLQEFVNDPAVLFVGSKHGRFVERAAELGIADQGQGRGVVCADFDRDGDVDIFIANAEQPPRLYRNDGGNRADYLAVGLQGHGANRQAIGARIAVVQGVQRQLRELRAGSNYVSQDPAEAFFGLGRSSPTVDVLVTWPDGTRSILDAVTVNQHLVLTQPSPPTPTSTPTMSPTSTRTATPTATLRPLAWHFTEVSAAVGLVHEHAQASPNSTENVGGGVAAGDIDGDGWVDLYVVGGSAGRDRLFRNRGDGTFVDATAESTLAIRSASGSGPTLADFTGDGWLDLFIGGVDRTRPRLFRNRGHGTVEFEEITSESGVVAEHNTIGAALGDYDRDGDLDLALAHWGVPVDPQRPTEHLWQNQGDGRFLPVSVAAGLVGLTGHHPEIPEVEFDWTFTPNFADIDGDGWPDMLWASDYGSSRVFLNRLGRFENATSAVISDENGMGVAIGDYDNDGDLDWFVSSIWDADGVAEGIWGVTGNRLYRNRGDGHFDDVTEVSGVREGDWGWASCFADFDNDGQLDLFHVNGFGRAGDEVGAVYVTDPARLFLAAGGGRFVEQAALRGIADRDQGRGLVCFDYDRDGDVDVLITNNQGPLRLYRNDGAHLRGHLAVRLRDRLPNVEAVGARITIRSAGRSQIRELRAGSNFVSQDPIEAHFGLGDADVVETLEVRWPDGSVTHHGPFTAHGALTVTRP